MSQLFASGSQNWNFSFSISPSSEYSGLISLKIDWFDLLAVQGTLRSLLQQQALCLLYGSALTTVRDHWKLHAYVLSQFSQVRLFAIAWTVFCQALLSMGFSRQEYWSGLPCPPPGDLSDPHLLHWQAVLYH